MGITYSYYSVWPVSAIFTGYYSSLFSQLQTDRQADRQTDRIFAIKITNMMINNETVKRQKISIKIETIALL